MSDYVRYCVTALPIGVVLLLLGLALHGCAGASQASQAAHDEAAEVAFKVCLVDQIKAVCAGDEPTHDCVRRAGKNCLAKYGAE